MQPLKIAAAVLCLAASAAWADTWPTKPVTVVVPYPPGGSTDVIGRVVAQSLGAQFKQNFIIENRPGFGGNVGARLVAAAPKDGYTLLMGAVTAHAISQTLAPATANYNLERDFSPVSMVGKAPLALVVASTLPVNSLPEFIALVKREPDKLTYASAGIGTTQHLGGELFQQMTKTRLVHVPYKGSGPAVTDLMGGQIQATFETGPAIVPYLKSGRIKAIAYANETRSPVMPEVPTAAEAGLPGFNVAATYGLLAPAGTPQAIVDKLNAAVKQALQQAEVKATLDGQGVIATYTTPAQTRAHIASEIAKWKTVITDGNVKPE